MERRVGVRVFGEATAARVEELNLPAKTFDKNLLLEYNFQRFISERRGSLRAKYNYRLVYSVQNNTHLYAAEKKTHSSIRSVSME